MSADPYQNATSQHRTEVEPDTFAFRGQVVGAFQVGRFFAGGATNIGWVTSRNGGVAVRARVPSRDHQGRRGSVRPGQRSERGL